MRADVAGGVEVGIGRLREGMGWEWWGWIVVAGVLGSGWTSRGAESLESAGFPCPPSGVVEYTAMRVGTGETPVVDGKLEERVWKLAPVSSRYVDLVYGTPTIHDTRAMVVWDEENLYFGIRVEEPFVRAKFTVPQSPIYEDNDVEVFVGGADAYYEFEVNAFNTPYEVFFIWQSAYEKAGFARAPEFARSRLAPFNGVGYTKHPRGMRWGQFGWSFPGRRTAVFVDGTVNDDRDRDRGWTVEMALPWAGMRWLATDGRALPPRDGDEWRIDFSRFNQYREAPPAKDSGGWALSPHGVWDSHIPECFPKVRFSTNRVGVAVGSGG